MWDVVMIVALVLCCLLAVVLTAVRLPGTWLIVAAAAGYGWWSDWEHVGKVMLMALVAIALTAEVIELLASMLTARRAGASRQAAWGGLIGGFLGMFLLSFLVPIPIVGTMIGALAGCFTGAMIAEWRVRKELAQGAKVGLFSAMGFVLGATAKVAIALGMTGIVLARILIGTFAADTGPAPP